ncbi:HAD family hydrolase [Acetobacteraceae bacterium]|nr:HAD family hydrolase [Acetobacteraceae bacterium]
MAQILHFDFDGTIADTVQCVVATTQESFKKFGRQAPDAEIVKSFMGIPLEISGHEMSSKPFSEAEFSEFLKSYRALYLEYAPSKIQVFPHVREILLQAKEKGCFLTIVTSKYTAAAIQNLKDLDLFSLFDVVVGSDTAGGYKPSAAPIRKAEELLLEKYGTEVNQVLFQKAWVFGDSTFDIEMAHNAGLKACAVTWGAHSLEQLKSSSPDFIADTPVQLAQFWRE